SVFAGYRKADNLPVAIKHISMDKVFYQQRDQNGKLIPVEVAVMKKVGRESVDSEGKSAPVSLLDWYNLHQEVILVQERPVPSHDLFCHIDASGGCLNEEEAKIIMKQLVDAAIHLEKNGVFHRDIKSENILIETGSEVPRVRLIDFGLSCFSERRSSYSVFCGTRDHSPPEWLWFGGYTAGPTTVWQLGVVLFEMVHRSSQFRTIDFLMDRIHIRSTLSENCRDFLEACLAGLPEERPTLEKLKSHSWLRT
ncbi:serine/threonine-protein kinase pim-1-like, partial [Stegastes partitus]|uniref:non-specific serine/threonine protein kinase n=1 Tax=Stegastes partitus TaxID=144197 RepID=A0A9Y4NW82_9TELE